LVSGGQSGSGDGVCPAERQLAQHILLIGGRGHNSLRYEWQGNADSFIVGEEEEPIVQDGPAHADAELIHRGAGLVGDVVRGVVGVEKEVLRVERRAVPGLIEVSMKVVGP